MTYSVVPPAKRFGWKKGLAGLGVAALFAGALTGGIAAANAAEAGTFNPFVTNAPDGQSATYGILTQGDLELHNGHNQSMMAVLGDFSVTERNGNARMQTEVVPTIDGTPTRLLVQQYVGGGGNYDVTDDFAKISDVSNLDLVQTGPGAVQVKGSPQGTDTIAVSNLQGATLDDFVAEKNVNEYFTQLDANIESANQCLSGMYELEGEVNKLTVENGSIQGIETGTVNYVDYADIEGLTVWSGQYSPEPSADAPLVVKVQNGTTSIADPFQFLDGKGSATGPAAYVLWDLSEVTNSVSISTFRGGGIYAPSADLTVNMTNSINTQIIANNAVFNASSPGDEIHQINFLGELPCGETPSVPEPTTDPAIGTTVAVEGSDAKVLPLTGGTVVDTVAYEGLTEGVEYTLNGEIRTAPEGEATGITAEAVFTAAADSGTTTVNFELSANQVADYAGQNLVVYEYLSLDGKKIAEHTDPTDEAQTFTVEEEPVVPVTPSIGTTVAVDGSDDKVLPLTGGTVVDTVAYDGLEADAEYTLKGEVRTAPAGDATGITAEAVFTADAASGTTTVTFEISAEDIAEYAGQDLVVFEYLYLNTDGVAGDDPIATHEDPQDEAQTFSVDEEEPVVPAEPKIGTTVAVDGSNDKVLPLTGGTVVDTVAYEGLEADAEYTLKGEVRTAPAGDATGITAEAVFTADATSGTTTVSFEISAEDVAEYAGQDLVVFEYLYLNTDGVVGDNPIATHEDPQDEAQTFSVEEEEPVVPATPSIGTTVAVDGSDDKVLPLTGGTVVDTVTYEGLTAGVEYTVDGEIRTAPEGEETGITATASFTPEAAEGTTTVTFEISADDVEAYAGQDLVVYEYLYLEGKLVAEHADPTDEAQTFSVEEPTEPTTPVEPTPTDPTEPEPTDPTEPEPTDPTTPVDPTDPTEPVDPTEPAEPTEPSEPIDPTEPTEPTTPVEPLDPTTPADTEKPTDPSNGGLAQTGADLAWPWIAGAVLLVIAGAALMVIRRKAIS